MKEMTVREFAEAGFHTDQDNTNALSLAAAEMQQQDWKFSDYNWNGEAVFEAPETEAIDNLIATIENTDNKQPDVARAYQAAFDKIPGIDPRWREINSAITKRWPGKSGLTRVKKLAWKIYEEKA